MTHPKKRKLRVQTDGLRQFITVSEREANDLHSYLRGKGVHSAPPQPATTGFDCIELSKSSDAASVQALLDAFA